MAANLAHRLAIRALLGAALSILSSLTLASLGGCVDTAIRTAPFRVRPDAAEPGSLQGPFNGRVVDATTHAAIAGALVYAAWTFERGAGIAEPAGSKEFVGSTDAAGNYRVPRLDRLPGGARVTEFTLLVYKRGFIAYRSDRRFSDLGPRMDFAQRSCRTPATCASSAPARRSRRSPSGSSPMRAPSSTGAGRAAATICGPAAARASTWSRRSS
ncbi:MAG: hypothetical protein E6J91_01120 [Deltaproteobacteria bacterium]|nr:MAG: hypothetical protein E6J91_01120 [Deltaproteobacteria bacterium]